MVCCSMSFCCWCFVSSVFVVVCVVAIAAFGAAFAVAIKAAFKGFPWKSYYTFPWNPFWVGGGKGSGGC